MPSKPLSSDPPSGPTSPPRRIGRELAFAIKDVGRMLQTYADQEVRRLDMTHSQWAVLSRIERHEGLKQSEIADMLDLQPITLTRLLDRLCDNGLIERRPDPHDRRAVAISLTAQGRALIDRVTDAHLANERDILQALGAADQQRLADLLRNLQVGLPPAQST